MGKKNRREAMLYEPLEDQKVHCRLCGHECRISPDGYGICRVRQNVSGKLISLSYDALVAVHVDPIEKKPLFHFLPGTQSLSVAAAGCNFRCEFCQNWQISQAPAEGRIIGGQEIPPDKLVALAQRHRCASISYTYTEPTVFYELAYDTAALAQQKGIRNCFVSNGYMTPRAVQTIAPYLDAINVDLKAFREETYRSVMKARLEPVLTCLKALVKAGIWVEVTTLVVPDMNDSDAELRDIARFIAEQLSPDTPWHVSRFHADYKMTDHSATPVGRLHRALEIGREAGLRYVYCGNVPGDENESTACPDCGATLIRRVGFGILENRLADGRCPDCNTEIAGLWA
ncbi:MAG: radical SAM protein [Phycisphaerae bacterium SM23_33]|nr:MAG: radical SAM protein [Phycisphaerae bacterium SM23_33]